MQPCRTAWVVPIKVAHSGQDCQAEHTAPGTPTQTHKSAGRCRDACSASSRGKRFQCPPRASSRRWATGVHCRTGPTMSDLSRLCPSRAPGFFGRPSTATCWSSLCSTRKAGKQLRRGSGTLSRRAPSPHEWPTDKNRTHQPVVTISWRIPDRWVCRGGRRHRGRGASLASTNIDSKLIA